METFIVWSNEHFLPLLGILSTLFVAIAKITPTPKDDGWVVKMLDWLNLLPPSVKERLNLPTEEQPPSE